MAKKFHITGMGMALPKRIVDNHELAKTLDTTDEWIVSHTGIRSRHICGSDETTGTLAAQAARIALENAGVKAEELGTIIVATSTPDFCGFPSTACLVQRDIGAVNASAMDIRAACTGFIYGMDTARALMHLDPRPALVVAGDAMSRIVDWTDRNTCVLFGDGAGAAVLQVSDQPGGITHSILRADGHGAASLYREDGSRHAQPGAQGAWAAPYLRMNGRQVFNFAVKAFEEVIRDLCTKASVSLEDVKWIVPHQANVRILEATARRLDIPVDRFFVNIENLANTSGATIPLALHQLLQEGKVKNGDKIMMVGFGAGLTWGGILVDWNPPTSVVAAKA
jgi:3-oxoacyl-[acyl-carrier-protein] synthase-3